MVARKLATMIMIICGMMASSMVQAGTATGNQTWILGLQDTTGSTLLAQYWDTAANTFGGQVVIPAPPATFWHSSGASQQDSSSFQHLWRACHQCVRGGSCHTEQSGSCDWYVIYYGWIVEKLEIEATDNCTAFTPLAFGFNHNSFTEGYLTAQCNASDPSSIAVVWRLGGRIVFRDIYRGATAGVWSADYSKAYQWPIDVTVATPIVSTFDNKGLTPPNRLTVTKLPSDALSIILVVNTDSPDAFLVATSIKGSDTSARWGWVQRVSNSEFQYVNNGDPQRLSFVSTRIPDSAVYDSITKTIVASSTDSYLYRLDVMLGVETAAHILDQRVLVGRASD